MAKDRLQLVLGARHLGEAEAFEGGVVGAQVAGREAVGDNRTTADVGLGDREAGGQEVRDYRPPYGIFSAVGLRAIRGRGWRPVLWSRWGRDWKARATPASIARRATADVGAGDVLLLHDADYYSARGSWVRTAAALPMILEELEARGLKSRLLRR